MLCNTHYKGQQLLAVLLVVQPGRGPSVQHQRLQSTLKVVEHILESKTFQETICRQEQLGLGVSQLILCCGQTDYYLLRMGHPWLSVRGNSQSDCSIIHNLGLPCSDSKMIRCSERKGCLTIGRPRRLDVFFFLEWTWRSA